ncbi:MAG TPA: hypothetical protein VNJ08_07410 [Bacteriovoracaceae bacterium]|nr:hypothetical protein [Bacteriovoracaceae bacterium]
MRFQIALLILLSSLSLHASDDKAMNELFRKYEQVMVDKKVELVDEVFTQKFLRDSGGKEEFISKVKELPNPKTKTAKPKMTWTKGVKNQMYLAKLKADEKSAHSESAEFIVISENGKLKIDGTAGDAE